MEKVTASHEKKTPKRKILWLVLLILCAILFIGSAVMLLKHILPRKNDYKQYHRTEKPSSVAEELPDNPIDFKALHERNIDICGWITIPGTNVDYPILQSGLDKDEDFYLTHNPDGKELFDGSIYIQQRNNSDFSDPNTVIYGHNLANGGMFTQVRRYRRTDFFNANQTVYIYTPGHILTYQIYSAFIYDNRNIINSFNFAVEEEFQDFINQTLHPASMTRQVREGVSVTTADRIITLSTCNNNPSQRYLAIGVLKNDQRTK